ncbi:hypothetical protein [Microseira sp. BLCC-F43]|jgi:hypothetical protein|uniref:hypothetical protein n=1 Tax=Microseira sp. BLCC-F43 TaxID=3153602 RepID=UPI0035B91FD4
MNADTINTILSLAEESDILLFGEIHGTQEFTLAIASLLDDFYRLNYRAIGLEISSSQQEMLHRWATGETNDIPDFFTHPSWEGGRGNQQVLSFAQNAIVAGWQIICFDISIGNESMDWSERDLGMAENLLAQWHQLCPNNKVVCICGNLHSRHAPLPEDCADLWPSFAAHIQRLRPDVKVKSINIIFHDGAFFNMEVRNFVSKPIQEPYFSEDKKLGHTAALHLPYATPATFLSPPS